MSQGWMVHLALMVGVAALALLTTVSQTAALAAAGGLVLCAGAARHLEKLPKLGLLIVIALVPLSYLGTRVALGFLNSLTKLFFLPSLAFLIGERVLSRRPWVLGRMGLYAALFGGTLAASYLVNDSTPYSLWLLSRFAGVLLLYFLSANALRTEEDLRHLLGVVAASCLLSAAGALWVRPPAPTNGLLGATVRMTGWSVEDAPTFGTNLLVALLICVYGMAAARRTWLRLALIPAAGVLLLGIVLTYARGVSVATAITLAILLFRLRRRVPAGALLAAGALILAGGAFLVPDAYWERMTTMFTQAATDPTISRRWTSYRIGWQLFQRRPLLGFGPGNFLAQYMAPEFRFDRTSVPSVLFNLYLSVTAQAGLLGLAAFGLLTWQAFRELRFVRRSLSQADAALRQSAEVLELILVALLLISLFEPTDLQKYLWMAFGAAAAVGHLRRQQVAGVPAASQESGCRFPC